MFNRELAFSDNTLASARELVSACVVVVVALLVVVPVI